MEQLNKVLQVRISRTMLEALDMAAVELKNTRPNIVRYALAELPDMVEDAGSGELLSELLQTRVTPAMMRAVEEAADEASSTKPNTVRWALAEWLRKRKE